MRRAHEAPLTAVGTADVRRADNFVGALVARLITFPRPGDAVPVRLEVRETADGTTWERRFGRDRVRTLQRAIAGHMVEHRGPGQLWFCVSIDGDAVLFESVRFSVFGLSFPRALTPCAKGRVSPTEDGWVVQIEVRAPLIGRLCAYAAKMRWET